MSSQKFSQDLNQILDQKVEMPDSKDKDIADNTEVYSFSFFLFNFPFIQ